MHLTGPALTLLVLLTAASLRGQQARPHPEIPLPSGVSLTDARGRDNGVRFVDLNGDGHEDIVFSNHERHGVYLYNDVEKKNLGWMQGWSSFVIREGTAGDVNALPLTTDPDVTFKDGAMWVKGARFMTYEELCRPPAPAPRPPEASLKAIHLHPKFKAELVAREPLVQDPIFVDWDARGRMWVVEMADYPFHESHGRTYTGRVKILEDTDGDGVYDKAVVFLDDLMYPTGLACWKNGIFVASVPDVFFAEDVDDDGKADKRTPMLQGFKVGNPQHLVNGFAWGLDGWFYGGNGDSGGIVTDLSTGRKHDLSGRDFRFNPVTGEFQLQSGKTQYGRWRDDFGNWFGNNNSNLGWHYFLDDRYLARNSRLAVPAVRHDLNRAGNRLYPVSPPVRRLNQPDTVNLLTSGCSLIPYRDELFGPAFSRNIFICEPANNLVHREVLEPSGVTFSSRRAPDESESEFLASEDNWSRFTQARTGPDGCLYVVDFYRLILEHPEWIPPKMIEHLDLRAGSDRGRIYRVSPIGASRRPIPRLDRMTDDQLGKMLESPNGWTRDTAQRLLMERRSAWTKGALSGGIASQAQQLWTLHALGTLKPGILQEAMRHSDARIRENAVRIAESRLKDEAVFNSVCELAKDDDLRVRVQVAFSLGESRDPRAAAVFEGLAKRDAATPEMLIALLSSSPDHPGAKQWQAMLKSAQKAGTAPPPPKIITNINPDREKAVKSYAGVAALAGEAARGHLLYTAVCSACHRLKNEGNEIGPDLGTVAAKPTEQLLEAILDPSRAVEQRYLAQTVTLRDGRQLLGMVAEETANSITLKLGATTEVILRSNIARSETGTKSMMPDGLESVLNPQQVADVLAWIRAK